MGCSFRGEGGSWDEGYADMVGEESCLLSLQVDRGWSSSRKRRRVQPGATMSHDLVWYIVGTCMRQGAGSVGRGSRGVGRRAGGSTGGFLNWSRLCTRASIRCAILQ